MNNRLKSAALKNIRIDDGFWNRYLNLVTEKIIPYQWEILNDRVEGAEPSHCISNFEIAAGRKKGEFHGFVFQDTDLAKWIEAAAYTLTFVDNTTLQDTVAAAIDLIAAAQRPDGYINTYFTIKEPKGRFKNLSEGHELYTAGHMMEAAVAYYEATGKDRFLKIMCKMADLLCEVFNSEEYKNAVPGHQEVEIGLYKLYKVTGRRKYLELAKAFIDRRGVKPDYLAAERSGPDWVDVFHNPDPYIPQYAQSDEPVRMQKTARGHAVRAVYMYCAMADIACETEDEELLEACKVLYEDIVCRQMYITGGIGQSGLYERFTTDYDLPNDRNYSETCAAIGLALFCRRMAQITHEEKYMETMETALYNTVLAGVALDGESFFYVNPLEVWPDNLMPYTSMAHVKPVRQKWFPCACCPPNIARTLASLGEYVIFTEPDVIWINMYVGCECETELAGTPVRVRMESRLPFMGEAKIVISSDEQTSGRLKLRIPGYADNIRIEVLSGDSKRECEAKSGGGHMELPVKISKGNDISVTISFDMPARFVYANSNVRADAGKTAVVKGPMVYAAEECDNRSNLSAFAVDTNMGIEESYDDKLMGGCMVLTVTGYRQESKDKRCLYSTDKPESTPDKLRLIPYAYWNNRGVGEMLVWMRYN